MRRALEALLCVLVAALALPAPAVSHEPFPPGPDAAAEAAFNQQVADATWDALPISSSVERPDIPTGEPLPDGEWDSALFECFADAGYPGLGVSWLENGGLAALDYPANEQLQPETQLEFYRCVVTHPRDVEAASLLSDAQVEYRYGHYYRWLVPCLLLHGYRLDNAPSYGAFVEMRGQWSPYWWGLETPRGDWVDNADEYDTAVQACGRDWFGS